MRCEEIKNLLSDYLDNDIDLKTKKLMDGHLAICANCAKELQVLKEIVSGLKEIPEVEPPPYFLEAVRARMQEPSVLAKFLRRLFVPVYIKVPIQALTFIATVIIIMFLVQKGEIARYGQPEMPLSPQHATQEAYSPQIATTEKIGAESKLAQSQVSSQPATQETYPPQIASTKKIEEKSKLAESQVSEKAELKLAKVLPREISSQFTSASLQDMSQVQSRTPYLRSKAAKEATFDEGFEKAVTYREAETLSKDKNVNLTTEDFARRQLTEKSSVITERKITVKTKDLEQDVLKLNKVLLDLGITNIQTVNYEDKVLFNFQIPNNKLELLLSRLKDWQLLIFPSLEKNPEAEAGFTSISINLTLITQETP